MILVRTDHPCLRVGCHNHPLIICWIRLIDDNVINFLGDGLGWLFFGAIKKTLNLCAAYGQHNIGTLEEIVGLGEFLCDGKSKG
jgi:hypothetical protein